MNQPKQRIHIDEQDLVDLERKLIFDNADNALHIALGAIESLNPSTYEERVEQAAALANIAVAYQVRALREVIS